MEINRHHSEEFCQCFERPLLGESENYNYSLKCVKISVSEELAVVHKTTEESLFSLNVGIYWFSSFC